MPFPKMIYHRIKGDFVCPSEEFYNTLPNKEEWEDIPFNGPRSAMLLSKNKDCQDCNKLKIDIKNIQIHNNELEILIVDYKQEIERLRIALKMAENMKKKLPGQIKKLSAARRKAVKDKQ